MTKIECAKDEVVELDFGLRDAKFEALVMNVIQVVYQFKQMARLIYFNDQI